MARDRPSPYGEGGAFFSVARGPVPRDRWGVRGMARDRPSPYGEVAFFIVARGPVPRDRWIARVLARDRPSPYDEVAFFPDQAVSPTGDNNEL